MFDKRHWTKLTSPVRPFGSSLEMAPSEMRIADPAASRVADENDLLIELLTLPGASVLELGCGKADKTRLVARTAASVEADCSSYRRPF